MVCEELFPAVAINAESGEADKEKSICGYNGSKFKCSLIVPTTRRNSSRMKLLKMYSASQEMLAGSQLK
jgi:hypothetical protein